MRRYVAQRLIAESADGPRLLAGRRRDGRWVFPFPEGPDADSLELAQLPPCGALWSFTVQRFQPKAPFIPAAAGFTPYAVGYVELPGALIVESRLAVDDFSVLCIGMQMQVTVQPVFLDANGEPIHTYAFAPVVPPAAGDEEGCA
jgi:uncharacterized OB-fold protein